MNADVMLQIDRMLAKVTVSGDSVLILAEARKMLGALYAATMEGTDGTDAAEEEMSAPEVTEQ